MKRREFVLLIGGAAAAWPHVAHGQQSAMPVIGYMHGGTRDYETLRHADAFRQGLRETGYIEDQNIAIEYRWAEDHYDRLPGLAADLVRRKVTVIAAAGTPAALAAKAATAVVPIVFETADEAQAKAVGLIERPEVWRAVVALADSLPGSGRFDGKKAAAIIRSALGD
jgi:putative ABC transport system substrate-binding protein